MNQMKIGAFISERRREKGWTQSQLAEKLGITDKAVSKWETGRSMPDLSMFMPLCALLDINQNSRQQLVIRSQQLIMLSSFGIKKGNCKPCAALHERKTNDEKSSKKFVTFHKTP